jgi:hypothetical protein
MNVGRLEFYCRSHQILLGECTCSAEKERYGKKDLFHNYVVIDYVFNIW